MESCKCLIKKTKSHVIIFTFTLFFLLFLFGLHWSSSCSSNWCHCSSCHKLGWILQQNISSVTNLDRSCNREVCHKFEWMRQQKYFICNMLNGYRNVERSSKLKKLQFEIKEKNEETESQTQISLLRCHINL